MPSDICRGPSYRDAAFMGIMRWALYDELKDRYSNVDMTFGYITKCVRIQNHLKKTHYIDARCITGNPLAKPLGVYYNQLKVRCHNRKIHKDKISCGGKRRRNQTPYNVFGFSTFDRVNYKGTECFVFGKRVSGFFDLRMLNGTCVAQSASHKFIKHIEGRKNIITEVEVQLV